MTDLSSLRVTDLTQNSSCQNVRWMLEKKARGRSEVRLVGWHHSTLKVSSVPDSNLWPTYALTYKGEEIIWWENTGIVKFKAPFSGRDIIASRCYDLFRIRDYSFHHGSVALSVVSPDSKFQAALCVGPKDSWFEFDCTRRVWHEPQRQYSHKLGRPSPFLQPLDVGSSAARRKELLYSEEARRREEKKVLCSGFSSSSMGVVWERDGQKWVPLGEAVQEHGGKSYIRVWLHPYLGHWHYGNGAYIVFDGPDKAIEAPVESPVSKIAALANPWKIYPKIDYWRDLQCR